MKIFVKAKPGAKKDQVEKIDDGHFTVSVKEPATQGRANAAIIKLLAGYFNAPVAAIRIISGQTSRNKIIEINKRAQSMLL